MQGFNKESQLINRILDTGKECCKVAVIIAVCGSRYHYKKFSKRDITNFLQIFSRNHMYNGMLILLINSKGRNANS